MSTEPINANEYYYIMENGTNEQIVQFYRELDARLIYLKQKEQYAFLKDKEADEYEWVQDVKPDLFNRYRRARDAIDAVANHVMLNYKNKTNVFYLSSAPVVSLLSFWFKYLFVPRYLLIKRKEDFFDSSNIFESSISTFYAPIKYGSNPFLLFVSNIFFSANYSFTKTKFQLIKHMFLM
ncbi:unnamed protein product [Rotaria socialis]